MGEWCVRRFQSHPTYRGEQPTLSGSASELGFFFGTTPDRAAAAAGAPRTAILTRDRLTQK